MRICAIASWIISHMDEPARIEAKEAIAKNGVWTGTKGYWQVQIRKSVGGLDGQMDALGVGRYFRLMESSLWMSAPEALVIGHAGKIATTGLTLDQLVDAPGIPPLVVLNARFERQGHYDLKREWSHKDEDEIWRIAA